MFCQLIPIVRDDLELILLLTYVMKYRFYLLKAFVVLKLSYSWWIHRIISIAGILCYTDRCYHRRWWFKAGFTIDVSWKLDSTSLNSLIILKSSYSWWILQITSIAGTLYFAGKYHHHRWWFKACFTIHLSWRMDSTSL